MEDVVKQCLFICTEREIKLFQCLKGEGYGHGAEVIRTWHLVQRRVGGATGASSGIFGAFRACLPLCLGLRTMSCLSVSSIDGMGQARLPKRMNFRKKIQTAFDPTTSFSEDYFANFFSEKPSLKPCIKVQNLVKNRVKATLSIVNS